MIERQSGFAAALDEHLNAIARRDIEGFARTLHRDVRLIGPTGSVIHGYDEAVAAHRGWFIEGGWVFEPSILWTEEREGAAWALTSIRYSTGKELTRFLLFLLFVRDGDRWKLIYDQNTPLTNAHP
ncbi:MAG TPA: nuclear transport factor 2 family protein [Candidatus Aquilonibacter sp.]|nr:nuclear transport factor 2 family protein [Candidatus Aquilonibacter sp.]